MGEILEQGRETIDALTKGRGLYGEARKNLIASADALEQAEQRVRELERAGERLCKALDDTRPNLKHLADGRLLFDEQEAELQAAYSIMRAELAALKEADDE